MSFFSIIIPAYNVSEYLGECLDSISGQTFDDYEVVIIDDESQDNTYNIIRTYAERFSWIKYEKIEHASVGSVRNKAMDIASGEYLMFVDADDTIESEMLQQIYDVISGFSPDICFLPNHYIDSNNGKVSHDFMPIEDYSKSFDSREAFINYTFEKCGVVPTAMWTAVCKREVIKNHDIRINPEYLWSEDTDFILQVLTFSDRISICYFRGYIWNRMNNSSSTRLISSNKIISRLEVYNKWIRALQNGCFGNLSDKALGDFETMLLRNYCEVLFTYTFIKGIGARAKIRKRLMEDSIWNKNRNLVPKEYYQYGLRMGRILFMAKHYFRKILGNKND